MKIRWNLACVSPALLAVSGLLSGCGGTDVNPGTPPPKPATAEEGKKATDAANAGMPKGGMKGPGQ